MIFTHQQSPQDPPPRRSQRLAKNSLSWPSEAWLHLIRGGFHLLFLFQPKGHGWISSTSISSQYGSSQQHVLQLRMISPQGQQNPLPNQISWIFHDLLCGQIILGFHPSFTSMKSKVVGVPKISVAEVFCFAPFKSGEHSALDLIWTTSVIQPDYSTSMCLWATIFGGETDQSLATKRRNHEFGWFK